MRGLPAPLRAVLEAIPTAAQPMDVLRTGASMLGTVLPERDDHHVNEARNIADRLLATFPSMLLYWYHYARNGTPHRCGDRRGIDRRPFPAPADGP